MARGVGIESRTRRQPGPSHRTTGPERPLERVSDIKPLCSIPPATRLRLVANCPIARRSGTPSSGATARCRTALSAPRKPGLRPTRGHPRVTIPPRSPVLGHRAGIEPATPRSYTHAGAVPPPAQLSDSLCRFRFLSRGGSTNFRFGDVRQRPSLALHVDSSPRESPRIVSKQPKPTVTRLAQNPTDVSACMAVVQVRR